MGGNIPGTQKIFSKYKFMLPYQNEPDSGIIAGGVTESRSVGRSDRVPTATTAVHLLRRSLQGGSLTALPRCKTSCLKYSFAFLAVNQWKTAFSPHR